MSEVETLERRTAAWIGLLRSHSKRKGSEGLRLQADAVVGLANLLAELEATHLRSTASNGDPA